MEGVQREDRSVIARIQRALSGVVLGAAMGLGAGYYIPPRQRLDRETYQGLNIDPIVPPSVPPIGGRETITPGISNGETHETPRINIPSERTLEALAELPPRTGVTGRPRDAYEVYDFNSPGPSIVEGLIRLASIWYMPTNREQLQNMADPENQNLLAERVRERYNNIARDLERYDNVEHDMREAAELLRNTLDPGGPIVREMPVQRDPWRPQLPMQFTEDIEYLAAGDQKLTEKPAVSVAGTPVTFWKGPLQKQHGTVECEYFGGVRSMMRVRLQKPLSLEEFTSKIPSRAKEVWENATKSGYVQDNKLAYFTVPWNELIIDASPDYLDSRKVRAEFDIGRQRCSGTIHSVKQSGAAFVTEKYVIELDEPVKGPKNQNYSIVAISKHLVRPIRTDTEKYIEMTVKGIPETGCTLKHEDMEIS